MITIKGKWNIHLKDEFGEFAMFKVEFKEGGQVKLQDEESKRIGAWVQNEATNEVAITMKDPSISQITYTLAGTHCVDLFFDFMHGNGVDTIDDFDDPLPLSWNAERPVILVPSKESTGQKSNRRRKSD